MNIADRIVYRNSLANRNIIRIKAKLWSTKGKKNGDGRRKFDVLRARYVGAGNSFCAEDLGLRKGYRIHWINAWSLWRRTLLHSCRLSFSQMAPPERRHWSLRHEDWHTTVNRLRRYRCKGWNKCLRRIWSKLFKQRKHLMQQWQAMRWETRKLTSTRNWHREVYGNHTGFQQSAG